MLLGSNDVCASISLFIFALKSNERNLDICWGTQIIYSSCVISCVSMFIMHFVFKYVKSMHEISTGSSKKNNNSNNAVGVSGWLKSSNLKRIKDIDHRDLSNENVLAKQKR